MFLRLKDHPNSITIFTILFYFSIFSGQFHSDDSDTFVYNVKVSSSELTAKVISSILVAELLPSFSSFSSWAYEPEYEQCLILQKIWISSVLNLFPTKQ